MNAENAGLVVRLRQAFENGEFVLHYQPIVGLGDGRMVGAEALLRWNHPSDGLIAPAAFLPALDESGLILEIGCWVMREAARQVEAWQLLYGRHIVEWVSVNLSARQLAEPAPLLATLRAIHDGGFWVHRLKLETTESPLRHKPEPAGEVLAELDRLGIRMAIDDFDGDPLSPTSLRHAAVDTIKISGELIGRIGTAAGKARLDATVELARAHDAAVIAAGIETIEQRDFLRGSGCGFGQGYLFAEPMDGALLGAHALTHAVAAGRIARPPAAGNSGKRPALLIPRTTSAGR